jgi:quercetin dioxygenase-like cupin family protein
MAEVLAVKDAVILPALDGEPVDRGPGIRTWHLVTVERGATEFLTGITEFDPGAALAFHFHNCQESVTVLDGIADFETSGGSHLLHEKDATLVPTGLVHRFRNPGPASLRILFVYGSTMATRTLVPSPT